jgi:hypothetical protein
VNLADLLDGKFTPALRRDTHERIEDLSASGRYLIPGHAVLILRRNSKSLRGELASTKKALNHTRLSHAFRAPAIRARHQR